MIAIAADMEGIRYCLEAVSGGQTKGIGFLLVFNITWY